MARLEHLSACLQPLQRKLGDLQSGLSECVHFHCESLYCVDTSDMTIHIRSYNESGTRRPAQIWSRLHMYLKCIPCESTYVTGLSVYLLAIYILYEPG
jgi:hypothetical protein